MEQTTSNAVYVQTNEAEGNRVIAFGRDADGTLSELGAYETGGRGDGGPHLTSQGSVTLTGDGSHLLVTNAGSGDVSVFLPSRPAPPRRGTICSCSCGLHRATRNR